MSSAASSSFAAPSSRLVSAKPIGEHAQELPEQLHRELVLFAQDLEELRCGGSPSARWCRPRARSQSAAGCARAPSRRSDRPAFKRSELCAVLRMTLAVPESTMKSSSPLSPSEMMVSPSCVVADFRHLHARAGSRGR